MRATNVTSARDASWDGERNKKRKESKKNKYRHRRIRVLEDELMGAAPVDMRALRTSFLREQMLPRTAPQRDFL